MKVKLSKRKCYELIALIWLLAIILCSYDLYNFDVFLIKLDSKAKVCRPTHESQTHMILLFLFQYLIPILIISVTCIAILIKLKQQKNELHQSNNGLLNKNKAFKMILLVLLVFFVCWTPLQMYNLAQALNDKIN